MENFEKNGQYVKFCAYTTLDEKSKSGLIVGVIYFFIFLATSQASKIAGKISSLKIKNIEKKTLLLGITFGLLCGVLYYFNFFIFSMMAFIFIYIIENLRKPILTGYLANNVPNEILTSVISVESFYKTLMTATLSILLGFLADQYGIGISLLSLSLLLLVFTVLLRKPDV